VSLNNTSKSSTTDLFWIQSHKNLSIYSSSGIKMPYVRSDANLALSRANWRALSLWFVFRGVRAAALEQRHDVYRRSASLEEHYEQPSLEARKREELARRATRWDEKCRDADTLEAAMWRAYHEYQAHRRAAFNECKRNMLIWLMWHQLVTVADHGCYRGIPDAERLSTTHHHPPPPQTPHPPGYPRDTKERRASLHTTPQPPGYTKSATTPAVGAHVPSQHPAFWGETSATRTEGDETDDDFIET
jgi:hypothetical protein